MAQVDDQPVESAGVEKLELQGVIGFNGEVADGLILHPGDEHILYPLGSTIVVKHLTQNTQTFLQKGGHDRKVSCQALSPSGKYLASGQVTHMGFQAPVIIWNLETYEIVHKLVLHVGKIQALAFSANEKYLATLGGRDDNKLVIWNVETGEPICGETAASETALTVKFFNERDDKLVTGGSYNLRVWDFNPMTRKIRPNDVSSGTLRRVYLSILIDDDDSRMFCGTDSGDIVKVQLTTEDNYLFKKSGPKKPFSMGVRAIIKQAGGYLVAGAGDGTVAVVDPNTLQVVKSTKFAGAVSSLALNAAQDHFFVGTSKCNIFLCCLETLEHELRNTCHFARINDVAFPRGYSELFATCSSHDIRVWHSRTRNELLRINVPNLECLCVTFSPDGTSIISGWSDGKIRAFAPRTGKLIYVINDAHKDGVTAIACTHDCGRVISGGQAGQVRVWNIGTQSQQMIASMKEHKNRVNSIYINEDGSECVSASSDGSCIVWSLKRFVRQLCLFANTKFQAVLYHPDQSQLLTTGSDRKLTYWDLTQGIAIRITDGSDDDTINCLDITEDGEAFVSAGADKLVKVWGYDEGYCYSQGVGHSGVITQCKISPDQRTIVTVGDEGGIFLWTMPTMSFADGKGPEDE
jgi:WD40 repeat protein